MFVLNEEALVLDIVDKYPETEKVFRRYEANTGSCLLCEHLFSRLGEVCKAYNLNVEDVIKDLVNVIKG